MGVINFFTSPVALDILLKLLIAFVLSSIIGIERELIHKPAGIKTHTLICISATLVMSLGMYMKDLYPNISLDPTRLPAQILAGIGFVGAGTIIREGLSVRGITTAASLLSITCIGLAVGAGFFEGAVFATLLIFLILCFVSPMQSAVLNKGKLITFNVVTNREYGILSKVQDLFEKKNVDILTIKKVKSNQLNDYVIKFFVKCDRSLREDLIQEICKIDGITEVNLSKELFKTDTE